MTTDRSTSQAYRDELLLALRTADVPGPRIAEALAEVESHVADTGEDPGDAFGPPRAYAEQLVSALGTSPRSTWRLLLSPTALTAGLGGAAGTALLLDGLLGLVDGRPGTAGLPAVLSALLGVAVLAVGTVWLLRLGTQDEVRDPRTGADLTPPLPRWVRPLLAAPVALVLVVGAALVLAGGR